MRRSTTTTLPTRHAWRPAARSFSKSQKKALKSAIAAIKATAERLWAAVLAVFNTSPQEAATSAAAGLESAGGAGVQSNNTVNNNVAIHTSGSTQELQAVVQRSLRRAQPALVRGF